MMRRHKHSWSHNELFAHKKNTGEQAKFRDAMLCIERKFGLVRDSIHQETSQVRTSLKSLRKSTGHSIDALPPTPFQLTASQRDDTFMTVLDPSGRSVSRSRTNPEFNYLLDDDDEDDDDLVVKGEEELHSADGGFDVRQSKENSATATTRRRQKSSVHANREHSKSGKSCAFETQTSFIRLGDDIPQTRSKANKGERKAVAEQVSNSPESSTLPPIGKNEFLIRSVQCVECENPSPTGKLLNQVNCTDEYTALGDDSPNPERHNLLDDNFLGSKSNNKLLNFEMPRSKENTTLTNSSDSRRHPSTVFSLPLSGMQSNNHSTNTGNRSKDAIIIQRRKDIQNRTLSKEKDKNSQMANTRTRCRTCLERYRQNVEFQRQKKLLEQDQQNQGQNLTQTAAASRNAKTQQSNVLGGGAGKSFLATDNDLDSLFAESEVLDFEEASPTRPMPHKKRPLAKKGYSKVRLQQLAEPRKGRRKKVLFSKHLIKKEVDDMMERHSQPPLTEKEKERIRILESKIRMFLAVTSASGDVMPSRMVHIPQREDIMTVDISHH